MKRFIALVAIPASAWLMACSDESSSPGDWQPTAGSGQGGEAPTDAGSGGSAGGAEGDASQDGSAQGGASQSGGASQGGAAGSTPPSVPLCQTGCASPTDCTTAGSYPASEWDCAQGLCKYLGCTNDTVCAQVFSNASYVCRTSPFGSVDTCQLSCASPSDCATDQGAFSSDNWECSAGRCVYQGCSTDAECKTTMAGMDYRCRPMDLLGYNACMQGCSVPADCAIPNSPAYAESTWSCEQGACVYLGCPSDEACKQSLYGQQYVCK